ncbi:MAG TPA: thioredoxin family protein [Acidimicrobiales bacterium]|nr:thioredoxin family protein [Acidimicrobiales bacterium]
MELGRRPVGPAPFFDDVDRNYVVAQLEGQMDAPVDLMVAAGPSSPLLLPGASPDPGADEGRQAEQLALELGSLEPRLQVTLTSPGAAGAPVFTVSGRASPGVVRFVGVPRVNLFRNLLEAIRRASTGDHGLPAGWSQALERLPRPVHTRVFATPTCPGCPPVVATAIGMGLATDRLRVEVVDGLAGSDLVREYGVSGVPTVVLDGQLSLENPSPDESLLEFVLHAADRSRPAPTVASVPFRACGRLPD